MTIIFLLLSNYVTSILEMQQHDIQGSPVISAMLNSSAPFIVQNWPGMEWIELSCSKMAWIIVQESPDYCSILLRLRSFLWSDLSPNSVSIRDEVANFI